MFHGIFFIKFIPKSNFYSFSILFFGPPCTLLFSDGEGVANKNQVQPIVSFITGLIIQYVIGGRQGLVWNLYACLICMYG